MKTVDCWHFAGDTLRDGRPLPRAGDVLVHEGEVEICASGFHGSEKALDALRYAPGSRVARVRLIGVVESQSDKHVARRRENLTDYVDASEVLRAFARRCALDVIHLWDAPDVVRRYLETGDETLRYAARDSAWDSARFVARNAAQATAWVTERAVAAHSADAAQDASWVTERSAAAHSAAAAADAAADAARLVARFVARDAVRKRQNQWLTDALVEILGK